MIKKELIGSLINDKLTEDNVFLVDLKVTPANKIYVEIDSLSGVSINYCILISKHIESQLDREEQDFELEVSTSSVSAPFKVLNHYKKNQGKEVEVSTLDNKKLIGLLEEVTDEGIVLKTESMQKIEGKKKKQLVIESIGYAYEEIRSTQLVLNFK